MIVLLVMVLSAICLSLISVYSNYCLECRIMIVLLVT